ncbi:crosslink repair DNA glycosylase YcaQ family protein [Gryllotalpicola daejeonensis]|uniref:Crosslink repair DNA glycosylase YcaQ family protein n=1 Tax=Gryllotalpicola daejeonensis TaxID=993087 RepID=A0ABP7ZI15_9MICO
MVQTLSAAAARRIALAAQGFGRAPAGRVGTRQLNGLFDRLGLLQIDSVNVFERSHYLPPFARLGAYDKALLDRLTFRPGSPASETGYTEVWAHEAAFIRVRDWPLFRFRHRRYREKYLAGKESWGLTAGRSTIEWLRAELAAKGPLAASEIEHDANVRQGPWWGWSEVKQGLEVMFRAGELATAGRMRFERRYALAEHVLPASVLQTSPAESDALRELVRRAVTALGIGTLSDIADYYRLYTAETKAALAELIEAGDVERVHVDGWVGAGGRPLAAFVPSGVRVPRSISATAVLSPFDPVVWERDRLLRMFGMHYRIEIYTPAPKRVYGYYTLPVLVDDEIVGRVDLKSDRQAGILRVQSAWVEEGRSPGLVAERLAPLLEATAEWQGLGDIAVAGRGNLAAELAAEIEGADRAAV